jgi:ABC-type phosphate transport system permease subunit
MIGYSLKARKQRMFVVFALFRFSALTTAIALAAIVLFLLIKGFGCISWSFLTEFPTDSMTKGGIFPAIVGTFYLSNSAHPYSHDPRCVSFSEPSKPLVTFATHLNLRPYQ